MFAAIPLLFAVQQTAEGIVWLTMDQPDAALLQRLAVNVFLGFALLVWPLWLPLSLRRIEHHPARRQALLGLCCAGAMVSVYGSVLLLRWHPIAQVAGHSIRYLYSPGSGERNPGFALILSLAAAVIVERDALTSVWCFFAAILSGLVLMAVMREQSRLPAPSLLASS